MESYSEAELRRLIQRAAEIEGDRHSLTRDEVLRICEELGISREAGSRAMAELAAKPLKQSPTLRYSNKWPVIGTVVGSILGLWSAVMTPSFTGAMPGDLMIPVGIGALLISIMSWESALRGSHIERQAANLAGWVTFTISYAVANSAIWNITLHQSLLIYVGIVAAASAVVCGAASLFIAALRQLREHGAEACREPQASTSASAVAGAPPIY